MQGGGEEIEGLNYSLQSGDSLEEFEYLYNEMLEEKARSRHPNMTLNITQAATYNQQTGGYHEEFM